MCWLHGHMQARDTATVEWLDQQATLLQRQILKLEAALTKYRGVRTVHTHDTLDREDSRAEHKHRHTHTERLYTSRLSVMCVCIQVAHVQSSCAGRYQWVDHRTHQPTTKGGTTNLRALVGPFCSSYTHAHTNKRKHERTRAHAHIQLLGTIHNLVAWLHCVRSVPPCFT